MFRLVRKAPLALRGVRHMAAGKDIKFGVEGRALMLQGVDMLADAVQVRGAVAQCGVLARGWLTVYLWLWMVGLAGYAGS